jgi:ABC-type transporter MlaC component
MEKLFEVLVNYSIPSVATLEIVAKDEQQARDNVAQALEKYVDVRIVSINDLTSNDVLTKFRKDRDQAQLDLFRETFNAMVEPKKVN